MLLFLVLDNLLVTLTVPLELVRFFCCRFGWILRTESAIHGIQSNALSNGECKGTVSTHYNLYTEFLVMYFRAGNDRHIY